MKTTFKKMVLGQEWWPMPVIPAFQMLVQERCCELKGSLGVGTAPARQVYLKEPKYTFRGFIAQ